MTIYKIMTIIRPSESIAKSKQKAHIQGLMPTANELFLNGYDVFKDIQWLTKRDYKNYPVTASLYENSFPADHNNNFVYGFDVEADTRAEAIKAVDSLLDNYITYKEQELGLEWTSDFRFPGDGDIELLLSVTY